MVTVIGDVAQVIKTSGPIRGAIMNEQFITSNEGFSSSLYQYEGNARSMGTGWPTDGGVSIATT